MQPMFLRRNRKRAGGEAYEYWTLCEAVRTERGPRQRIVATLGKVEPEARQTQRDWSDIDALLEGRPPARPPASSRGEGAAGAGAAALATG